MTDLTIVPHGAVLIRNGIVEDVGPARRVENLAGAKHAREIDATGKVVMPAFIDPDMTLVTPLPFERGDSVEAAKVLRVMSRQRVQAGAVTMSSEWARYGCLTVGARTPFATDIKATGKVLRTHQSLQSKPLRIRSILSPTMAPDASPEAVSEALISKWLPAFRAKKLASVLELMAGGSPPAFDAPMLRMLAVAAAGLGYAIRMRSETRLEPVHLQLALSAGAIAIVAPNDNLRAFAGALAGIGCVRVISATQACDEPFNSAAEMRKAMDNGTPIALASSYRTQGVASCNMQFLLHLAVDRLGMTAAEAITATTWNAACSLRLSHVTGSIEPGKAADLLVMDVPDYRELPRRAGHHDVSIAMRGGNTVFRASPLNLD
jgi:imidazolonepropionase